MARDQWRNNSRKNEGMEPKQKQHRMKTSRINESLTGHYGDLFLQSSETSRLCKCPGILKLPPTNLDYGFLFLKSLILLVWGQFETPLILDQVLPSLGTSSIPNV